MQNKIKFEALGSFRGIAALLIAIFHFPIIYFGAESPLIRHSYILTNLFFGLSGFILMAAYGNRLSNGLDVGKFVKRRLFRLYPMYLITTLLVIAVPFISYSTNVLLTWLFKGQFAGGFSYPEFPLIQLLADSFMLQGFGFFPELHLNFPAWSMGALFYCSVVFALIATTKKLKPYLFAVAFGVSFSIILFRSYAFMGSSYDYGIFRCGTSFFGGVLAWYLWNAKKPGPLLYKWAPMIQSATLILTVGFITWVGINTERSLWSPLVWTLFILAFSIEQGDVVQALKHPLLIWLSERSYALFLSQAVFLFMGLQAHDWIEFFELDEAIGLFVGSVVLTTYLALSLLLADFLYRNVELRLLKFAK